MAVELRPLGVKCNIQCQYCYQNPQRDAGNILRDYDFDRMMAAVQAEGGEFVLFGGEPLLLPISDLERIFAVGMAKFGSNGIQTNGALITDAHIVLFRQYKVSVGISLDGPAELNDARWAGTLDRTRVVTARVEEVIESLCREGMPPRLIITLHRGNATHEKLPVMRAWLKKLEGLGVQSVRLHLLEVESPEVRTTYALSAEENQNAIDAFADLERELTTLQLDVFEDMRRMLLGRDDRTTCVWNACDPYTTRAVRGVEGNGQRSNCGRTNKEGIDFTKAATEGYERYIALYQTSQDAGGCQGCRFFLMCKGQCPGTALDNDWRNRSEHCEVWKSGFARVERELLAEGKEPLSLSPLREILEVQFLTAWSRGHNTTMAHEIPKLKERALPSSHYGTQSSNQDGVEVALPAFTRVTWVSDTAQEVWGPRLLRLKELGRELEWRTVAAGIRRCGFARQNEDATAAPWSDTDLTEVRISNGADGLATSSVAIGRAADLAEFTQALQQGEDQRLAALLGHPQCCREFHRRVWIHEGREDATWPVAMASPGVQVSAQLRQVRGSPYANTLWKWLGIGWAFHVPCRFDCDRTVEQALHVASLARASGLGAESDWLDEVLSWPIEWSALHGIAEIRTPILKICTRTDATASSYSVQWLGDRYPAEGAMGIRFPYRTPRPALLTLSTNYRGGLAHASGGVASGEVLA